MADFDLLGLGHRLWPFKDTLKVLPAHSTIGFFHSTFGPIGKKPRRLLEAGHDIRPHIWWDDNHKIAPIDVVVTGAKFYEALAKDHPERVVWLSHSCEYNEPRKLEVQKRIDVLRKYAPNCRHINACWRGATLPDVPTERHGFVTMGEGDIASTDGAEKNKKVFSCYDMDIVQWIKDNQKASLSFLWGLRFNLREITDEGERPPKPLARTAAPSKEYIESIIRLSFSPDRPEGTPPPGTQPIKAPNVCKTHSEDEQGTSDPRENKPVLIVGKLAKAADVVTINGKSLGQLVYGGTYKTNQHRYYSGSKGGLGLWGYQIGKRALAASGSEWVYFQVGKQLYGPVNPAFRTGLF